MHELKKPHIATIDDDLVPGAGVLWHATMFNLTHYMVNRGNISSWRPLNGSSIRGKKGKAEGRSSDTGPGDLLVDSYWLIESIQQWAITPL